MGKSNNILPKNFAMNFRATFFLGRGAGVEPQIWKHHIRQIGNSSSNFQGKKNKSIQNIKTTK